jgi:tetratricopeptide (TPR) repeat protein
MQRLIALLAIVAFSAGAQERGKLVENLATRRDATQTYTLYLPTSYDAAKKQPLLLIFDPRGRATLVAGIFREAAEEYGWILVSSNGTRSDESNDPNEAALRALLPEIERYAVDKQRVYATGFSGTAMLAWSLGIETGWLAGVIGVGGRVIDATPPAKFSFAHYGFAGEIDFNNSDMRQIDELLERAGKVHRFQQFEGDHRWIDSDLAREALGYMEIVAMKSGLRTRDDALIAKLFDQDDAIAGAWESSGRRADALRRYREIVRTYDGFRDVDAARAAATRLERDAAIRRELDAEAQWDQYERRFAREVFATVGSTFAVMRRGDMPPTSATVSRHFRLAELKRRAKADGPEGRAARRLLETAHVQLAFYLMRSLVVRGDYALAAATVGAATEIHPERFVTWYNLGAMQARAGDRKRALQSLEKSIELGYKDATHLVADEDYAALREDARFKALVARIR